MQLRICFWDYTPPLIPSASLPSSNSFWPHPPKGLKEPNPFEKVLPAPSGRSSVSHSVGWAVQNPALRRITRGFHCFFLAVPNESPPVPVTLLLCCSPLATLLLGVLHLQEQLIPCFTPRDVPPGPQPPHRGCLKLPPSLSWSNNSKETPQTGMDGAWPPKIPILQL